MRSMGVWGVNMITQAEIAEQLNLLIDGAINLEIFEDWLAVRSWNMHADSSDEAQKLAWAIELNLSEFSSGHLDEAELRQELEALVPLGSAVELRRRMEISSDVFVETGSGDFIDDLPTQSLGSADTIFGVAFGSATVHQT